MTDSEYQELQRDIRKYDMRRRLFKVLAYSGALVPILLAVRHARSVARVKSVHDSTNPGLTNRELQRELDKASWLPRSRVSGTSSLHIGRDYRVPVDTTPADSDPGMQAYTMPTTPVGSKDMDWSRPYILASTRHPKVLMHELGHAKDMIEGKFKDGGELDPPKGLARAKEAILWCLAPKRSVLIRRENSAWDNARVPESDPLRRAAVDTYRTAAQASVANAARLPVILAGIGGSVYNADRQNALIDKNNAEVERRKKEEERARMKKELLAELSKSKKTKKTKPPKPASGTSDLAKAACASRIVKSAKAGKEIRTMLGKDGVSALRRLVEKFRKAPTAKWTSTSGSRTFDGTGTKQDYFNQIYKMLMGVDSNPLRFEAGARRLRRSGSRSFEESTGYFKPNSGHLDFLDPTGQLSRFNSSLARSGKAEGSWIRQWGERSDNVRGRETRKALMFPTEHKYGGPWPVEHEAPPVYGIDDALHAGGDGLHGTDRYKERMLENLHDAARSRLRTSAKMVELPEMKPLLDAYNDERISYKAFANEYSKQVKRSLRHNGGLDVRSRITKVLPTGRGDDDIARLLLDKNYRPFLGINPYSGEMWNSSTIPFLIQHPVFARKGKVLYSPNVMRHEFGHRQTGVLGQILLWLATRRRGSGKGAEKLLSRLLDRNTLLAATRNPTLAGEYIASSLASGIRPYKRWPAELRAAFDSYSIGQIEDMFRHGPMNNRQMTVDELRRLLRSYREYI